MYQDDEMGAIMKKGVEDQLAVHKLPLVAAESYKRGATDFSSQIAKLKKADVQLVVLATVIRETVGALKEAKKLNWEVDMAGMSPAYTSYVVGPVPQGRLFRGRFLRHRPVALYLSGQPAGIDPQVLRQAQGMVRQGSRIFPHQRGTQASNFFAKVAQKVGKDLTREKWIDAAENYGVYKDEFFGGVPIQFTTTNHQGAFQAIMSQVKDNKFVKIADVSYK